MGPPLYSAGFATGPKARPFGLCPKAPVAELVDALDLKSSSARSAGSIPARGTSLRSLRELRLARPASPSRSEAAEAALRSLRRSRAPHAQSRFVASQSRSNTRPHSRDSLSSGGCHLVVPLRRKGAGKAGRRLRPHRRVQWVVKNAHGFDRYSRTSRLSPRNGFTAYTYSPR